LLRRSHHFDFYRLNGGGSLAGLDIAAALTDGVQCPTPSLALAVL
jgi:hypothetical protein